MAEKSEISTSGPLGSTNASRETSISLLGCGWLGIALAPALQAKGLYVRGSTTRTAKLSTLSSLGIEAHLLRIEPNEISTEAYSENESQPEPKANSFFNSETLVINLPTEAAFGDDFHPGQLREILTQLSPKTNHVLYVSSTSVYGREQGEVDETTCPLPDPGSGEILVASEKLLMEASREKRFALTIVRAGGLIGPGRHPGLFLAGRKNVRDGEGLVNLIHQTDLVNILTALATSNLPQACEVRIYNAVAPSHPTREEFYQRVSAAVGVEAPQFAASLATPISKVVHGHRVVEQTGIKLVHGDLYSGLGLKS